MGAHRLRTGGLLADHQPQRSRLSVARRADPGDYRLGGAEVLRRAAPAPPPLCLAGGNHLQHHRMRRRWFSQRDPRGLQEALPGTRAQGSAAHPRPVYAPGQRAAEPEVPHGPQRRPAVRHPHRYGHPPGLAAQSADRRETVVRRRRRCRPVRDRQAAPGPRREPLAQRAPEGQGTDRQARPPEIRRQLRPRAVGVGTSGPQARARLQGEPGRGRSHGDRRPQVIRRGRRDLDRHVGAEGLPEGEGGPAGLRQRRRPAGRGRNRRGLRGGQEVRRIGGGAFE